MLPAEKEHWSEVKAGIVDAMQKTLVRNDPVRFLHTVQDKLNTSGPNTFRIESTEGAMDVNLENLSIHVENERDITIVLSGLYIRDSYTTNLKSTFSQAVEYQWQVDLCGVDTYAIGTMSFALDAGTEIEKSLQGMQHNIWKQMESKGRFNVIGDIKMSYTKDSIIWTCSIPEDYPFDFSKTDTISITIYDISRGYNKRITYTIESG